MTIVSVNISKGQNTIWTPAQPHSIRDSAFMVNTIMIRYIRAKSLLGRLGLSYVYWNLSRPSSGYSAPSWHRLRCQPHKLPLPEGRAEQ